MAMKCTVQCDNCNGLVEGLVCHTDGYTGGFYLRGWVVAPNKGTQNDLFPEDKNILCDFCMQSSDGYQRFYGTRSVPGQQAPVREPRDGEVIRSAQDVLRYIRCGEWPKESSDGTV